MPAYSRILLPWDSQPQEIAEVNPGPSFVWTPTQGNTREAISGIEPASYAASGPQAVETGAAGFAARGGSSRASRWDATRFRGSTDYTLLAVVLDDTGRSVNRNPFDADNTSGTRVFQFRVDSGNKLSFIPFNTPGSNWPVGGVTNTPSDRPIVIAARAQNNNLSVWLEGRQDGTSTASGTLRTLQTSGAQLSIGATPTASYTQGFGGQIYLCVHYPYALSDAELSSIRTPGAAFGFVFAPRSIWVPVSVGGGSASTITAATGASTASTLTASSTAASTPTAAAGAATASTVAASSTAAAAITSATGAATASTLTGSAVVAGAITAAAGVGTGGTLVGTGLTAGASAITPADGAATASTLAGSSVAASAITPAAGVATGEVLVGTGIIAGQTDIIAAAGTATTSALAGSSVAAAAIVPAAGVATANVMGGPGDATQIIGGGGWLPMPRRRTKKELDDERRKLGILPPEVVEEVAAVPVARRRITLQDLIGKRAAAEITNVDLSAAIAASKRRKRQRDDELLLLM